MLSDGHAATCLCKGIKTRPGPRAFNVALGVSSAVQEQPQVFSCMLRVSILLNSVILILQDAQSCKRRTTQCHCSFESMMSDTWRKYSQAWDTLFQTEQKTRDLHTFTLLVINIEIRHWSAVKNMKAVLVSALGMGSFWSWKALKGSSLFSCSYFCLSEHKLLQPLPRLLVSKKRKAVSI